MKVLHIVIGLGVGGAENFLKRLILSHKNHPTYHHSVISLTTFGKIGEQLKANGVEVKALGLSSMINLPKVFFSLFFTVKKLKPDIVHTWMYHADFLGGFVARLLGIKKVIWSIRCSDYTKDASFSTRLIIKFNAFLSNKIPKRISVNSISGMNDHIKLGFDKNKIVFIPNGYDLDLFSAKNAKLAKTRIELNVSEGDIIIGIIGRFHPMKDHHSFIKAIRIVLNVHPNIKCIMIGKDINWKNLELVSWLNEDDLANHFLLLDECQNIQDYLKLFNIYCSSASSEGFPNVIAESMALGVPCVVTDVGDSAVIVADTGIVVPAKKPLELAQGLLKMIALPKFEREMLGQKSRNRIELEYSMPKVQKLYESLYQQVNN